MRLRILVTAAAFVAFFSAGTLLAGGPGVCAKDKACCADDHSCCAAATSTCCASAEKTIDKTAGKKWSVTNFVDTVMVNRTLISGPVMVVHDDEKMARGEPCTTFYRFDRVKGQQEELVSFHCKPRRAEPIAKASFALSPTDVGIKRLVEYQLPGETEAHGVPR